MGKNLSNPYSTGGRGAHFEAHVQASFVTLMLTGGHTPCLPCWPIVEVKLQGKIARYETDDCIVFVENPSRKERRKLLCQIKNKVEITDCSTPFKEVIESAWNDFNNPLVFSKNKDRIALITGPLSGVDANTIPWLLNQARTTSGVDEFFLHVEKAKFSPSKSKQKLTVIQNHLKTANGGSDVSREELYEFLRNFFLLGYDLGDLDGVVLSLLHSHISQFQQKNPQHVWSRIVDIVQTHNQNAGTITRDNLPEDLLEVFEPRNLTVIPDHFRVIQAGSKICWSQHSDATLLALVTLSGGWSEMNQADVDFMTQWLGISDADWQKKAREILHLRDSPLSLKNGIWQVRERAELWAALGQRLMDSDLDRFRTLIVAALQVSEPEFKQSQVLVRGVTEGLAILGSLSDASCNTSQTKVQDTCILVIRDLLRNANSICWGRLDDLLPALAEAAPKEFLEAVEAALSQQPSPFVELLTTKRRYLYGLIWALEGLAWDEIYLVRVCVILAELSRIDPSRNSSSCPFESLITILLPWLPQTLASIEKRKVAVQTIQKECSDIGWNLIIELLPNHNRASFGSHKPKWRKIIPADWKNEVTHKEYLEQIFIYAEMAVTAAGQDPSRLATLVNHLDTLPQEAFDQLLQVLPSQEIINLPENQRLVLWDHITEYIKRHRRFPDENSALPSDRLSEIELVAKKLSPAEPFYLYQHLFAGRDFDDYQSTDVLEEFQKKLDTLKEAAINEILRKQGFDTLIQFAKTVSHSAQVGQALGAISDSSLEKVLLPDYLAPVDNKLKEFVSSFIWRCYFKQGWEWCDNLDKSGWSSAQIAFFLAALPFSKEAWDLVTEWLQDDNEYWLLTGANPYQAKDNLAIAIEKLLEHGRPRAALNCLYRMHHEQQPIDANQCIQVLLAAVFSPEANYAMDEYYTVELIKFLQAEPGVNQDKLYNVEYAYLPLLTKQRNAAPKLLESRLASNPEFFSEVIRLVYCSRMEDQAEPTEESRSIAGNAFKLLNNWRIPPGTKEDGTFSSNDFSGWLDGVKDICTKSGHLEFALNQIGEVLIQAPSDPDGLWIHRTVAQALNDNGADKMRDGYRIGIYNARGAHWVDPSGKPERGLSEGFRKKAEEIENAGFQRFAATLRDISDYYLREAEQIVKNARSTNQ